MPCLRTTRIPWVLIGSLGALLALAGCPDEEEFPGDDDTADDDTADDDAGPEDQDGDGYTEDVDCDDNDDQIYPGAPELCDGIDGDCDGTVPADEEDEDGDGFRVCEDDCDDTDDEVHPGAEEVACDEVDNDCDGAQHPEDVDDDGDQFTECDGDCDDADDTRYPGACECTCGVDSDCDGIIPADADDADKDGYCEIDGDCDDTDATRYPGNKEIACNGVDNDCDGDLHPEDVDDDGDGASECGGDCDDADDTLNLLDVDGDKHTSCAGDCDDADDLVYPGAAEICDGVPDNNCDTKDDPLELDDDADGATECDGDCDDNDVTLNLLDADKDGQTTCDGDCDDAQPSIFAHAIEVPQDGTDQNCDGLDHCVDLDCDNWTDLVFANNGAPGNLAVDSTIYWGSGQGYDVKDRTGLPTVGAQGVEIADLDGDGYLDLVFANHDDGATPLIDSWIYWGGATGYSTGDRTALPTSGASDVLAVDADGDGFVDLIFANHNNELFFDVDSYVYFGSAQGYSAKDRLGLQTLGASGVCAGDLDGDTFLDIVFSNHRDAPSQFLVDSYIYWGGKGGIWHEDDRDVLPTVGGVRCRVDDLDGDSYLDIAFANMRSDDATFAIDSYVYWGNDTATYSPASRTDLPTLGAFDALSADLDGDGEVDLILVNQFDGASFAVPTYLYWGDPGGFTVKDRTDLADSRGTGAALHDLDGDGHLDLVLADYFDGTTFLLQSSIFWGSPKGFSSFNRTLLDTHGGTDVAAAGPGIPVVMP